MPKANGSLVWNVDVNSAKAFTNLSQLKGMVRSTHREWMNQYQILMANNKQFEAQKVKVEGLQKEYDKQRLAYKQTKNSLDSLNKTSDVSIQKKNKIIKNERQQHVELNKTRNNLEKNRRIQHLYTQELNNAIEAERVQKEQNKQNINVLKSEGKEYEAQQAKIKGTRNSIAALTKEAKAYQSSMVEYAKTQKQLADDVDYQRQNSKYKQTVSEIERLKSRYADLRSGQEELDKTSKQYNETTKSLIERLKTESGEALANKEAYSRLAKQREMDIRQYELQAQKMNRVAKASGTNSIAFSKEQEKLNEIGTAYSSHAKLINKINNGYKNLSVDSAKSIDRTNRHLKSLNSVGKASLETAHRMTTGSMAVGGAFLYGTKQASQLQNTFIKTSNLMSTSGEKQNEVQKNTAKMQKDAKKYAIAYGESQTSIAKGYEELTRRGYSSQQSLASQKTYLQGAIASGDSYSDVVKNGAAAIEAFGKKSDNSKTMYKNTKEVINQLSYASDLTASNFSEMGTAMRFTGATAKSAGQKLSETSAAVGQLSNNGQNASVAGVGLRKVLNSFTSISDSPKSGQGQVLKQLGLSKDDFRDSKGNLKGIADLMNILNSRMKDYTSGDKAEIFHKMFGTTGQESANILSSNTEGIKDLNKQIEKSQNQGKNGEGYIAKLARKNLNSPQEQFKRFRESMKSVAQGFAETILPTASKGAKLLANLGEKVSNLPKPFKTLLGIAGVATPTITAVLFGVSGLTKGIRGLLSVNNALKRGGLFRHHEKVSESVDTEAFAYDRDTLAVKRNTEAKELNSFTGGGSSGPMSSRTGINLGSNKSSSRVSNTASEAEQSLSRSGSTTGKTTQSLSRVESGSKSSLGKLASKGSALKSANPLLKIGGKALPFGIAATSLIGMNKKNAGSSIGGATGNALGSMIPIPGVDIAASMGGGFLGEKLGGQIQKSITNYIHKTRKQVQDKVKPSKQDRGVSATITNNQEGVNNNIQDYDGKPKVVDTNGVNKSVDNIQNAEQAINSYYDNKDKKSEKDLKELKKHHLISKKEYKQQLKDDQNKDSEDRKNALSNHDSMIKDFQNYQSSYNSINNKWNSQILSDELKYGNNSKQVKKDQKNQQKDLLKESKKLNKQIANDEENSVKTLSESLHKVTGKSADIAKQFRQNYRKSSVKDNDRLIDDARDNAKQRIKLESETQEKKAGKIKDGYNQSINYATDLYKNQHQINKQQYDDMVKTAQNQRDDSLKPLTEQVNKTIQKAKEQYENISKYANQDYQDSKDNADKKYNDIVKKADKTRDDSIKSAKEKYKGNSLYSIIERNKLIGNAYLQHDNQVDQAEDSRDQSVHHAKKKRDKVTQYAQEEEDNIDGYSNDELNDIDPYSKKNQQNHPTENYNKFWDHINWKVSNSLGGSSKGVNKWYKSLGNLFKSIGSTTIDNFTQTGIMPTSYATGTGLTFGGNRRPITKNTLSMLNDGPQSNNRELAILPNGQMFSPKDKKWTGILPKGTEVLNADDTQKYMKHLGINHFDSGTGILSGLSDKAQEMFHGFTGGIKSKYKALSNLLRHKNKSFDSIFTGIDNKAGNSDLDNAMVQTNYSVKNNAMKPFWLSATKQMKQALSGNNKKEKGYDKFVHNKLGNNMFKFIRKKLSNLTGGSNPKGTSILRWKSLVKKALRQNGFGANNFRTNEILSMIQRESGGNPNVVNTWDSNAKAGNPSKGLAQTIQTTFDRYKFHNHDNILNGYDNLLASINYAKHRYGKSDSMFSRVADKGYKNGGLSKNHKLAEISEGNKSEMVLPLTDKSRAVKLIMKSLDYMFGQSSSNNKQNNSSEKYIKQLLNDNKRKDETINKILDKMDNLIEVIQNKPVISDTQIYQANRKQSHSIQKQRNLIQGGF